MIQQESVLKVADNSGGARAALHPACWAAAIASTRRVGDVIIGTVKVATPNAQVKKGDVVRAVVVRTTKEYKRPDGSNIPLRRERRGASSRRRTTREDRAFFGPVARELRASAIS